MFLERLQAQLLQQELSNEDEMLVAIAGIKQVSYIMKMVFIFFIFFYLSIY